jgi:hypothetical protein
MKISIKIRKKDRILCIFSYDLRLDLSVRLGFRRELSRTIGKPNSSLLFFDSSGQSSESKLRSRAETKIEFHILLGGETVFKNLRAFIMSTNKDNISTRNYHKLSIIFLTENSP